MFKFRLNLRKVFAVAICLASSVTMFAQDIILLKNGNDIQAIVQEVGINDVKYKRFDNPNGPNYMLKKSEVFMIRYANGTKDVFTDNANPSVTTPLVSTGSQPSIQNNKGEVYSSFWGAVKYRSNNKKLTQQEFEDLMYATPETSNLYKSARSINTVATIFSAIAGGLLGYNLATLILDGTYNPPSFYAGCGMFFVGVTILPSISSSKTQEAISIYNTSVRRQQTSNLSLNFGITQSGGIGLTLQF